MRVFALLILGFGLAASDEGYLALKARFYDHDYGDLGGEFSAKGVSGCKNDIHAPTRGMVQDTLGYDSAQGRKVLRRGPVTECSDHLESWFDPATSRALACGTLFLRNVGDSARPVWRYDAPAFFPVDSISSQRRYAIPGGGTLENDYAYCMEINAALELRGGETIKLRGDDDAWLYLDGRLILDQGGVHIAQEETVALDTLAFLKGKAGRTIDLDVYYCSRQPPTAVFGLEAAARLKPLALKSVQITDSAGRALASQDLLVGRSRVCARANYQSPGEEQCGNYEAPTGLSFLSADWDLNGKPLSIAGGQACLDLDPADFPNNQRITLTARAGRFLSRVAVSLVRPARPAEGLLSGDGRAQRVEVRLDSAWGPAPDGMEVGFDFAGARRSAWIRPDAARPWTLYGHLEGDSAGPFGMTGFDPVIAVTRQSLYGRNIAAQVPLRDGIGPVLSAAVLHWGAYAGLPAWIELRTSEALGGAVDSLPRGLQWKRPEAALPAPPGELGAPAGEARYALALPAAAARALKAGDSVSLAAPARDAQGNPASAHFVPIAFPRNLDVTGLAARVRPDPARSRAFVPRDGAGILIPVDAAGNPLDPAGPGADRAADGGPVLEIPLPAPLARIRMRFHDHLGAFVNEAERAFTEAEWNAIRAASPGDTTVVRLLWHPVSRGGERLGTGAYVAEGRAWTRDGLAKAPSGEIVELRAASLPIAPVLFGYLRE